MNKRGYGSMNADILASTLADYEAQVEDLTQRLNEAAADLLETRSQRAHLAKQLAAAAEQAIEHAKRHAQLFDEWVRERAQLVEERDDWKSLERISRTERDEARDEVVRLGREAERWKARCHKAWEDGDQAAAERIRHLGELVRLRTIIGELGAAEAAEPPPDLEHVVDQQLTAEDYGRFFPERGDDGQPLGDEEIEALRPEGEQP